MFKLFSMMTLLGATLVVGVSAAPPKPVEKDTAVEQADKKTKSAEKSDEDDVVLTPEAFSEDVTNPSSIDSKDLYNAPVSGE